MLKKYFGNKDFYKMVLMVAVPIMIQNGITNFVSLLDNIMVGQVGTEQMSGVAIVNQLVFVFNLCIFGTVSGAGIFTAQFHGKGDTDGVRQTFRFKVIACTVLSILAIVLLYFCGDFFVGLYLNEGSAEGDLGATSGFAKDYLLIMLIGLFPYALSQSYSGTLRETEHTMLPMVAGLVAVVCNCTGNWILIFGNWGAPVLGVRGAAIATVLSRFVELAVLIIAVRVKSKRFPFIRSAFKHLFTIHPALNVNILKKGLPLLINETLWATGISALAQCYSMRGLAGVAAYNIESTVFNVFNIAYIALGNSVGIIIGKYLGAKKFDEVVDVDRKMITFCVLVGVVMGVILFSCSSYIPLIYNTTDEVKHIATELIRVTALFMPTQAFLHSCYFTLRSGGKTILTFFYDSFYVCVIDFPIALLFVHFTNLSIVHIFAIVCTLDFLKCFVGYALLKKKIWIHQII